jgi:error-prone DNA polymerase
MAWDLEALAAARRDHGPEAVARLLGNTHLSTEPQPQPEPERQRTINMGTGAQLHPWADLQPADKRAVNLRALGYTSPGSAG